MGYQRHAHPVRGWETKDLLAQGGKGVPKTCSSGEGMGNQGPTNHGRGCGTKDMLTRL